MNIKLIINAIKSIGFNTGKNAVWYSIVRDINNLQARKIFGKSTLTGPGHITNYTLYPNGANIAFDEGQLRIIFLTNEIVQISWSPGKPPLDYTIVRREWDQIEIYIEQKFDGLLFSSQALHLEVKSSGEILFRNESGDLLRTDLPPRIKGISWSLPSQLRQDEHLYGLGERATSLNLVGKRFRSWNTDPGGSYSTGDDPLYICTPVLLAIGATGAYLIYFENPFPATFDLSHTSNIEFSSGALQYYFIIGTPEQLYERYTELTGRPAFPPRWVFGYHQSRWGYQTEDQIRSIAAQFESRHLPISAIHLDIDYMDGYRVFTSDKTRFPDLYRLSNDLLQKDIHLVTIIDPGVKKDNNYHIYQEGIKNNLFCKSQNNTVLHGVVWPGWAAYPDFTNPVVRQWWGNQYQFYLDAGISGFWHDMNEPVSFCAWGENTLPLSVKHHLDGHHGNHLEAHNLYALLMNKATYEMLQSLNPDKRNWLISRSGWAGLQRYAWNWTGDVASTWEALHQTLITLMGLSLSGHFFSGSDIGGFSGNPSAELYLRWFQLSTFIPFFRTHSAIGTDPREPWSFGEPYTSIIRQYLELRYELIPYFYTLAWQSHQEGLPIIRPLFWNFPDQSELWDIDDQFSLGDDLLIAPVLHPESKVRQVTLPPGDWYYLWDDVFHTGPTNLAADVALDRIPVWVRAGSILPREISIDKLELHVYPTHDFEAYGKIYSDTGDGYGSWRLDEYQCSPTGDVLKINCQTSGDYKTTYQEICIVLHGKPVPLYWNGDGKVTLSYASGSIL